MSHRFPRIQRSSGPHARRPHGKTPVVSEPNCATSDGRLTDADTWRRFFLLLREHADAHATDDRNLSATWSSLSSNTLNPYEYRREPRLSTLPISLVDRDRRFVTEPLSNSASSDAAPMRFLMRRKPRPKPSNTLGCRHIAETTLHALRQSRPALWNAERLCRRPPFHETAEVFHCATDDARA